ncbi:hypothetical protein C5167_026259 [Papaver somniferum]|nr:hypothetical protein C5167_026259 [Papaver somniferum]
MDLIRKSGRSIRRMDGLESMQNYMGRAGDEEYWWSNDTRKHRLARPESTLMKKMQKNGIAVERERVIVIELSAGKCQGVE